MKKTILTLCATATLLATVTLTGCTNEYNYPNRHVVTAPGRTVVVAQPTVVRTTPGVIVR